MLREKAKIQHFLANIFTVLDFEIESSQLTVERKDAISKLIKIASLIVTHEDLILGKDIPFFKREASLNEMIQTSLAICEDAIRKSEIAVDDLDTQISVNVDRSYLGEALTMLIREIVQSAGKIGFSFNKDLKTLYIDHDSKRLPNYFKGESLLPLLNKASMYDHTIAYQLALRIFQLHGEQVSFHPGRVHVAFGE